jgi:DNA repair protein RadD
MEAAGGIVMQLRPYQQAALAALDAYWEAGGGHPLCVLATATGKSVLIGKLIADIAADFPALRTLVLVHVRELLEQNRDELLKVWPDAPYGINSAGLGERNWQAPIVLANVQSVWRNPQRLGRRDLIIIDESHLVPHDGDGMYRSVITELRELEPMLRFAGFTATPYRLDSGRLDEGDGKIFDDIVFNYGIAEGIRDGWLAPLSSKATAAKIDVSGVAVRGGEFIAGALEDAADDSAVVNAAVDEIVARGRDRRSWLLFCCGVRHAQHVGEALRERGVVAATVTAETPSEERKAIIAAFRAGEIRALTNVNVLTTGFNVPAVDLIAMLRPTLSTGLYVQMVGRGTRKADGKYDCLVLDFASNVMRHGPVDRAEGTTDNGKAASGVKVDTVAAKRCLECGELIALRAAECVCCGHEFPIEKPKVKHAATADWAPIMGVCTDWLPVTEVSFRSHTKFSDPSAPPSLRVEYLCGLSPYAEYISLQRAGYAREMAERWWYAMGGYAPVPFTVAQALERTDELSDVLAIMAVRDGKYWRVVERRLRRSDGSELEVNRHYRCVITPCSPTTPPPINDEVPY